MVPPLAAELAPVRVNAVRPGVVDTPWWAFVPEAERATQLAAFSADSPVGRPASPAEIAHAISYLVSAPMATGTIMAVDGGMTVA